MRRIVAAVMTAGAIVLSACSNATEQKNDSEQKDRAEISKAAASEVIIRTEVELQSLFESIKPGEVKGHVTLVGVLHVGAFSSIKADPSKLTIGNTSVIVMMDHSNKHEYDRQASTYDRKTVLLKADISKPDPMKGPDFEGPLVVNIQHIEIMELP